MKRPIHAALLSACAITTMSTMSTTGATTLTTTNAAADSSVLQFSTYDGGAEQVRFAQKGESGGLRRFEQASSARMREAAASFVAYSEFAGMPQVRSGSLAFDALFAQAIDEMKRNSVAAIRDGAYNDGKPIVCECFETGEKWNYVWTRDLSYAADLGLAMLDPERVRNSLEFKLSGYRKEVRRAEGVAGSDDGLQIVQDTGSGGSWPVSSDRVAWAFGADQTLKALAGAQRRAFAATALKALSNTLENDRLAAFDERDGLYTGEQSFLDWREQTYVAGIADDLARMASAKALSTNVAHFKALTLAARLAQEEGREPLAARYRDWAEALKLAINKRFWLESEGLYSSLTAAHFDGAPMHKFDWLGQALAIVTGVADEARARRILASYPHGPMGAPVIHPQQPGVPIYHNRAIWPFVTAYGLDAAVKLRNVSVADAAYATLVRAASVHLSNMENLEWLSGQAMFDDPRHAHLNGPVINSRRQLWSVGGYIGMVVRNVFGIGLTDAGIAVRPFITARLRREMFGGSSAITLDNLRLHGRKLQVRIALPAAANGDGYHPVAALSLNGRAVGETIAWDALKDDNLIEVRLGDALPGEQGITRLNDSPQRHAGGPTFAPFDPRIDQAVLGDNRQVALHIADAGNPAGTVHYHIYRNGKLVAERVAPGVWMDHAPLAQSNCYAVEAVDAVTGLRSHHSQAVCVGAAIDIAMSDARVQSNLRVVANPVAHLRQWGAPEDRFSVERVAFAGASRFAVQLRYKNTGHAINTGISNGVKLLTLRDAAGRAVTRKVIQMPHVPPASAPMLSTPAEVALTPGTYTIELSDFYNMSYLASNALYGAGGGKSGPLNRIDLYGVRVLPLE